MEETDNCSHFASDFEKVYLSESSRSSLFSRTSSQQSINLSDLPVIIDNGEKRDESTQGIIKRIANNFRLGSVSSPRNVVTNLRRASVPSPKAFVNSFRRSSVSNSKDKDDNEDASKIKKEGTKELIQIFENNKKVETSIASSSKSKPNVPSKLLYPSPPPVAPPAQRSKRYNSSNFKNTTFFKIKFQKKCLQ